MASSTSSQKKFADGPRACQYTPAKPGFLRRPPPSFENVKFIARWKKHLTSFLQIFLVAELPQKNFFT